MWHYHHPLLGCNMAANQETLLGYALDGFPIYGPLPGTKSDVDFVLDKCNGRASQDGAYRYHVRNLAHGILDDCGKPKEYRSLLYALCFYHAIVQDRRKFGPLGWSILYDFAQTDISPCTLQLRI
jgi:hypothetical protein